MTILSKQSISDHPRNHSQNERKAPLLPSEPLGGLVAIAGRMKSAREALGLTQGKFCELYGYKLRTYQKNEAGESEPGILLATAFSEAGINAHWLLTGKGEMLLQPAKPGTPIEGYVAIPVFAGFNQEDSSDEDTHHSLLFNEDWVRAELKAKPEDLSLLYVHGTVMEPAMHTGDVVLFDRSKNTPSYEGMYVLQVNDVPIIRTLQMLPDGQIRAISQNLLFEPFTFSLPELGGSLSILGQVVWVGKKV